MDIEKAIDYLYSQMEAGLIKHDTEQEVYELATTALGKQVPRKITRDSIYSPALCPSCHTDEICKDLGDGYYSYFRDIKFCPRCGQMLDWGND